MQNVLADLALESEAATLLAMRLAAAVDAGETGPAAGRGAGGQVLGLQARDRGGRPRRWSAWAATATSRSTGWPGCSATPRPGSLWEGAGQHQRAGRAAGDVAAAALDGGAAGEIDRARGATQRLDGAMDEVAGFLQAASREARRDPAAVEAGARWMVERLAVVLQASLLVRYAPTAVSSAFLATRVGGGGGSLFGTLPVGRRTTQTIVERYLPG